MLTHEYHSGNIPICPWQLCTSSLCVIHRVVNICKFRSLGFMWVFKPNVDY